MSKRLLIAGLSVVFVSCANVEASKYAQVRDVIKVEKEVKRNRFAVKQALAQIVTLKEVVKQQQQQIEKQGKQIESLREEIERLKKGENRIKTGHIRVKYTYLRSSPKWSHNKVIKLRRGERVEIVGREGEWLKVRVKGKEGYLHEKTVKGE